MAVEFNAYRTNSQKQLSLARSGGDGRHCEQRRRWRRHDCWTDRGMSRADLVTECIEIDHGMQQSAAGHKIMSAASLPATAAGRPRPPSDAQVVAEVTRTVREAARLGEAAMDRLCVARVIEALERQFLWDMNARAPLIRQAFKVGLNLSPPGPFHFCMISMNPHSS
jgi:hypothetical protein